MVKGVQLQDSLNGFGGSYGLLRVSDFPGQVKNSLSGNHFEKAFALLGQVGFTLNQTIRDISRHHLTYGRKVGQVDFPVGQVENQTSCQTGQANNKRDNKIYA